jgi:hypothetical protein
MRGASRLWGRRPSVIESGDLRNPIPIPAGLYKADVLVRHRTVAARYGVAWRMADDDRAVQY